MINVIFNVMNVFNDRGAHLHTAALGPWPRSPKNKSFTFIVYNNFFIITFFIPDEQVKETDKKLNVYV